MPMHYAGDCRSPSETAAVAVRPTVLNVPDCLPLSLTAATALTMAMGGCAFIDISTTNARLRPRFDGAGVLLAAHLCRRCPF
jgi:hypothetical protein